MLPYQKSVSECCINRWEWVTPERFGFHSSSHPPEWNTFLAYSLSSWPGTEPSRLVCCPVLNQCFSLHISSFVFSWWKMLQVLHSESVVAGPASIWWGGWWWDMSILSFSIWKISSGKLSGCNQLLLAPQPNGLVSWDCAQPALWKTSSPPGQGSSRWRGEL